VLNGCAANCIEVASRLALRCALEEVRNSALRGPRASPRSAWAGAVRHEVELGEPAGAAAPARSAWASTTSACGAIGEHVERTVPTALAPKIS
jgi:hypothetical protein